MSGSSFVDCFSSQQASKARDEFQGSGK